MSNHQQQLHATFKSEDTEEWLDKVFTRPVGLLWARLFNHFDVHPNTVTILSIVLGVAAGVMFSFTDLTHNIIGVCLLVWANIYDSTDGQMARMTGRKTLIGRILDGVAGDFWFITIYISLIIRLWNMNIPFTDFTFQWGALLLCAVAGLGCHGPQCNLADYYRNIHLFFVKGKKGSELDTYEQQETIYQQTTWSDGFIVKIFRWGYRNYTRAQEKATPQFQVLMATLRKRYGDNIPDEFRQEFRKRSLPLMKYTNILTFNTRAIALYVSCLLNMPYLYPLFEITVLTSLYFYMKRKHEKMCRQMNGQLLSGY